MADTRQELIEIAQRMLAKGTPAPVPALPPPTPALTADGRLLPRRCESAVDRILIAVQHGPVCLRELAATATGADEWWASYLDLATRALVQAGYAERHQHTVTLTDAGRVYATERLEPTA